VIAHPRRQLARIGPLDQVIVGAGGEGLGLDVGVFLRRQQDYRDVFGVGVGAQAADHLEAVDAGHAQVDQHHRGHHFLGELDCAGAVAVIAQAQVGAGAQAVRDERFGQGFVVDQQYRTGGRMVFSHQNSSCRRHGRGRSLGGRARISP
jgi:hypothetical protein